MPTSDQSPRGCRSPARGGGSSSRRVGMRLSRRHAWGRRARARSDAAVSARTRGGPEHAARRRSAGVGGESLVVEAEGTEPPNGVVGSAVTFMSPSRSGAYRGRRAGGSSCRREASCRTPGRAGRVADRLVHLQRHLLGVDHDVGDDRRALARRGGAPPPARRHARARGRARGPRRTPSPRPRSSRRARSGSCGAARSPSDDGDRIDPADVLDQSLVDLDAVGREQHRRSARARTDAGVTTSGRAAARPRRGGRGRPCRRACTSSGSIATGVR